MKKIVATKTDLDYGYIEGDILEIVARGYGNVLRCKNISNPKLTDGSIRKYALLTSKEYEAYKPSKHDVKVVDSIKVIKLFGIPIFKQIEYKVTPLVSEDK